MNGSSTAAGRFRVDNVSQVCEGIVCRVIVFREFDRPLKLQVIHEFF